MKRLSCILALLILPSLVLATGRCVISRRVVAPAYVAPVKAAVVTHDYQAIALTYPVYPYAAGYNPGYELGYQRGSSDERLIQAMQALAVRIGALEQRLSASAPPQTPVPAPMPAAGPDPFNPKDTAPVQETEGLTVLRNSCAKCHDPAQGAVKGSFTLLNAGQPVPLTCEQILKVSRRVYLGEMPPRGQGGPLSPENTGAVMALMAVTKPGR